MKAAKLDPGRITGGRLDEQGLVGGGAGAAAGGRGRLGPLDAWPGPQPRLDRHGAQVACPAAVAGVALPRRKSRRHQRHRRRPALPCAQHHGRASATKARAGAQAHGSRAALQRSGALAPGSPRHLRHRRIADGGDPRGVLYLKDGNGASVLDAETGAERGRIAFSDDPGLECRRGCCSRTGCWWRCSRTSAADREGQGRAGRGPWTTPGRGADPTAARQSWFLGYDSGTLLAAAGRLRAHAAVEARRGEHRSQQDRDRWRARLRLRGRRTRDLPRLAHGRRALDDRRPHRQAPWRQGRLTTSPSSMLTFRPDALITPDVLPHQFVSAYFQVMSFAAYRRRPPLPAVARPHQSRPGGRRALEQSHAWPGGASSRDRGRHPGPRRRAMPRSAHTLKPLHGLEGCAELRRLGGPFTVSSKNGDQRHLRGSPTIGLAAAARIDGQPDRVRVARTPA